MAVHAAGKELAFGVGLMAMSTEEIKSVNKGCGVEMGCSLGDDLWSVLKI